LHIQIWPICDWLTLLIDIKPMTHVLGVSDQFSRAGSQGAGGPGHDASIQ